MHIVRIMVVLLAVAAASQALVVFADDRHVATVGELVELCTVSEDDPAYEAAMGFCLGYIDAALDYHEAITSGADRQPIVCPDPAVTRGELIAVFLARIDDGSVALMSEIPVEGVMRAVSAQWPCP
jgi:hypothetical protein